MGPVWWGEFKKRMESRPKKSDVAVALQQLSLMLSTGIQLLHALDILARESEHPHLRRVFHDISDSVGFHGMSFSAVASRYPEVFTDGTLLMIRAGEESGDISERLNRAGQLLEKRAQMNAELWRAVTSPLITTGACTVVLILLIKFVMPRFLVVFDSMEAELPLISKFVISSIEILDSPHFVVLVVISVVLGHLYRRELREWGFRLGMHFGWTRKVMGSALCVQFMDIMAAIHKDGIPLSRGLTILAKSTSVKAYASDLRGVHDALLRTGSLSEAVSEVSYFPTVLHNMLTIGEETGEMSASLSNARTFVELQNQVRLEQALSLLEPVLLAIMGIVMGVVCVGMFLPIYSLLRGI